MKDKRELRLLKEYFRKWSIKIIQINENISTKAMFLVEDYYLSHSIELADAIIASTALESNEILLTGNDKHYGFIRAEGLIPSAHLRVRALGRY